VHMVGVVEKLRFSSDVENYQALISDETVGALASKRLKNIQEDGYRRNLLGNSLRITKNIAPNLYNQVKQAQEKLGLEDKTIEIYIFNSADPNASCSYLGGDRIILSFSSGLLTTMNEDEINFVVGHELGHALFEHYALPTHGILEEGNLEADKAMQLMSWSRRAEVSADRAGLYVCESPDAAISSFLKLSCGVADPIIAFNRDEYAKQIQDLGELATNLEDASHCYSSHPFNPIRVLAVELFANSESYQALTGHQTKGTSIEDVDTEINKILHFMEPVPDDKQKETVDLCTFWAGVWVALADGEFVDSEYENLKSQVSEDVFNNCIAELEATSDKLKKAQESYYQSAKPLKTLSAPDRCSLVQKLIVVARADQSIDDEELKVLYKICDDLKVEQSFVQQILMFLD